MTDTGRVRFDRFELDLRTGELFRDGGRVDLEGRAAELVRVLVQRAGTLVTRDDLRAALWPADTFVDFDANINAAVRRAREALGDSATTPRFIETLPRRGYRFAAAVRPADPARRPRAARVRWAAALVLAAGLAAGAAAWVPGTLRPTVAVEPFANLSGEATQNAEAAALGEELIARLAASGRADLVLVAEAGRAADYAVTGTTRRDASGLYVTARLVDRRDGRALWADSFACPRQDLFAVQRQVAAKVADALGDALEGGSS